MNGYRFAWVAGTLGILVGCSGRYDAGTDPASSAGSSSGKPDSSSGNDAGGSSSSGAAAAAAASPAVAGASSTAGASSLGGSSGDPDTPAGSAGAPLAVAGAPSVCGVVLAPPAAMPLASTEVIWRRLSLFLGGAASAPPAGIPAVTTRDIAGTLAMTLLDRAAPQSLPGMDRFVSSWWPGTPIASTWAAYFSTNGATLAQLLTTNAVSNPGAGLLTDEAVLNAPGLRISRRGAFLSQHLLCTPVPLAPPGLPDPPSAQPGETRRARLEKSIAAPSCAACHALMDPLGDGLEHFDTVGAFSNLDNGSPIDSSGTFQASGVQIRFNDANQLGLALAGQCAVAQCVAQQMLADAETSAKLPKPGSSDPATVAPIAAAFNASGGDLHTLVKQIVQSDTFLRP